MSFNEFQFNSTPYNQGRNVVNTGSGALVNLEQQVAIVGSGALVSLEQDVDLYETGSGALVSLAQSVENTGSGVLVSLGQRVVDDSINARIQRRKYGITAFLDGLEISESELTDTLSVEFEEGVASQATLVLFKGEGSEDPTKYFGKTLIINGIKPDLSLYRIFTGVVDIVDLDVLNAKTTITATNRRQELIEAIPNPTTFIGTGYNTSLLVQTQNRSTTDLINDLLPFAPKALDFNAYNQFTYTNWEPKSTADYTITDAGIFRRDPEIEIVKRGRIINQIDLKVNYSFTRLHYTQVSYNWSAGFNQNGSGFGDALRSGYSFTPREMILTAIEGTGWPVRSAITFVGMPLPGWYGNPPIGYFGDAQSSVTEAQRDVNGNAVSDSNGNTVYNIRTTKEYDLNGVHATQAGWTLTNRWSQQGVKQYSLSISNTTSQSTFGVLTRNDSYSFDEGYDSSRWDDYKGYESSFVVGDGNTLTLSSNQTHEVLSKQPVIDGNIQAAIDKARTEILATHRENFVRVEIPFMPEIQLHHTVELSTTRIDVKGKVKSYTHFIDLQKPDSYTELELSFYYIGTGGSDSSRVLPTITPSNPVSVPTGRTLGSFYGVDPNISSNQRKDGYFGNRWNPANFIRTSYTEQFRVDTIAIPAALVDGANYAGSSSYTIAIPSSTLTDVTYEK